jgi:alkylhydroperoxidase/carboxymuconolactone decarboxylase family protein YurZ
MNSRPIDRRELPYREVLRRLSLNDEQLVAALLAGRIDTAGRAKDGPPILDQRTRRLVAVAALIAIDAGEVTVSTAVDNALAAGAAVEEIVDVLLTVAPSVGSARVVAMAPKIAASIGYDLSQAFEEAPAGLR